MSAQFMDDHFNFRMSSYDKKIVEAAAKLKGLKPNTYARQKLLEAAKKDITDLSQQNTLVLNEEEWEFFINIMKAPIEINLNLKKAVNNFRKKIGS